ncbi:MULTISPECIES: large conductance mechanosensitive channel protein MscL [Deinococcus]|uniref:Large-conductance mechanosensitive channel n=1 Tax=Deinococcus geothermalis (strain DSM 11300 / CIP 105573 / AG-3a) TaxID=319795 RepID=Q1J1M6_DEIGD|nr:MULTISPECIES: large conductance mechanosensitive channel protein MscL [Deinococcus]ABF44608.1 large conductance mechanosensitive channel protein [Deinococcus geothermalis DSM 11300]MBI0446780.1 large conductance mechanosensitive channel protein MscL [Deinococcus sp. DB0503]
MLRGFRNFILRGNVVDLAVGVVVGAAFTNVVNAFSSGFINPLIKAITGGGPKVGGAFTVNGAVFDYGAFITAIINFLIVAAILYFLVVTPLNRLSERLKHDDKPAPAEPSDEAKLLAEIRDELRRRPGTMS